MRIPHVSGRRCWWCFFFGFLALLAWLGLTELLHFYELNAQHNQFVTVAIGLNDYEEHFGSLPKASTKMTKTWRQEVLDTLHRRFPHLAGEDAYCTSRLFSLEDPHLCIFALRDESGEFFWNLNSKNSDPVIAVSFAKDNIPILSWDAPVDIFVDEVGGYIGSGPELREYDLPKSAGFYVLRKSGSIEWVVEEPNAFFTHVQSSVLTAK